VINNSTGRIRQPVLQPVRCRKAETSANSKPILSRGRFINFIAVTQFVTSPFPSVEILGNFVSKSTNRATSRCFAVMVSAKIPLFLKKIYFI